MELQQVLAGPQGLDPQAGLLDLPMDPQAGLLDLPEELLRKILRRAEDVYLASGETSAEFLQLRAVCKKLKQGVDLAVTNLSRGIAPRFCHPDAVLEVRDTLQRQLAHWDRLRRVELQIRASCDGVLTQLVPALGGSCPGLIALRISVTGAGANARPRACEAIAHLSSLAALESLSLTGFQGFSGRLPPLPSLRVLDADCQKIVCASPLLALEELAFGDRRESHPGSEDDDTFVLRKHRIHTLPRLRRLSLGRVCAQLLGLPTSLQVLELVNVDLNGPIDLGKDLPELAELLVVHKDAKSFPLEPQGLSKLLSQRLLLRLKLQRHSDSDSVPSVLVPDTLSLQTRMTALSLRAVQVPHLPEALATLTALTELELGDLRELETPDFSRLSLQHLRLEGLPKLRVMEGLELQTCLRSLAFARLGLITRLPNLHLFPRLTVLELTDLQLENWNTDSCSDLPSLKVLRVAEVGQLAPQAASVAPRQARAQPPEPEPVPFSLTLGTLGRLTELDLKGAAGSAVDLSSLPLLENLRLQDCYELSHLSGLHGLSHLRSLKLLPDMPKLLTLNITSCPCLVSVSCRLPHLQHVTMEDLPRLKSLSPMPDSLQTLAMAACHSLEKLDLGLSKWFKELHLAGLLKRMRRGDPFLQRVLRSVKLAGLGKLSSLVIENAEHLESVQVSDCPLLVDVVLDDCPKLTAPPSASTAFTEFQLTAPNSPQLPPSLHPSATLRCSCLLWY